MIIDCHTHLANPEHIGGEFLEGAQRAWGPDCDLSAAPKMHEAASRACDAVIVLPIDAEEIGYFTPNEFIADYVNQEPSRRIGFASVNPNRIGADKILREAVLGLGLKGLKLGPIYQKFNPAASMAYPLYAMANQLGIPIMWHQGTSYVENGPLEYSNAVLLDPVARSFPDLKMIVAHLGHPWFAETACLVRKHPNVYTDMSALSTRPWQMYNAMITALEYGIEKKIFFGTDFPFFTAERTIEAFRNINSIVEGTRLPRVPEQVIEDIIHRNTLEILGLD